MPGSNVNGALAGLRAKWLTGGLFCGHTAAALANGIGIPLMLGS